MKITEFGPLKPSGSVKKRTGAGGVGGFSELLDASSADDASSSAPAGDVAATAALSNLLALQEISEEDVQRKKLMLQGKNLLDSLDNLRSQVLAGIVPLTTLLDLKRQLSIQKQFVTDPRLNELIEDIELRAAVELAKLEMASKNN